MLQERGSKSQFHSTRGVLAMSEVPFLNSKVKSALNSIRYTGLKCVQIPIGPRYKVQGART